MSTQTQTQTVENETPNLGVETEPVQNESMTLKDALAMSKLSKVTILKIIKEKKVSIVGKVNTGGRGRPANLYNREEMIRALISST